MFDRECRIGWCEQWLFDLGKHRKPLFRASNFLTWYKRHGWNRRRVKAEVEESCPWLPQLLQAALNIGNEISKQATEMENAATYKATRSMEIALQTCKASCTLAYVDALKRHCQRCIKAEEHCACQDVHQNSFVAAQQRRHGQGK